MRILLLAAALLASGTIQANTDTDCFIKAGHWYQIDPDYIRAIAWQESRYNPAAKNYNRDSKGQVTSTDYGLMQINNRTLAGFRKEYPQLSTDKLLAQPCLNIFVGAMVLRRNFNQYGTGWLAVGMYNAGVKNRQETIANRYAYAMKIDAIYKKIRKGEIPRLAFTD
ncbi:lytic transglycosylase domain-containing protein [Candidatus Pantoea multigeneris]|uniref:Lytic transglycosylase domain-containing protein n=1 Tax=Candidatus Pantoea multigeneris TaxID=2608357 RepID=A0ABX0RFS5_9GAMM|nr:lytic transglycosylase domain-containing protein [Pantoea multigeneris]NIF23907.1 lytic transglycosylase domain-containing protein [Pantoea multigeneris]